MIAAIVMLLLVANIADANDIVGCGGFVEASTGLAKLRKASDPKLDYSDITVELHTREGLVKDKTQCAPNGYYFLPVYEKGSFLLKIIGPSGWSFDPYQASVVVDQKGCNDNEDINFYYTGFTLSGKVVGSVGGPSCKGIGNGPADLTVSLTNSEGYQHSVLTAPGGTYKFENLLTGSYKLEASHPTIDINLIGSPEVKISWGNAIIDDIFVVLGYTVEGSIVSQGNPVLGVVVFLHSDDVVEVDCPQGCGDSPLPKKALCCATSDGEGNFKFRNVPCGDYSLVPFYKGENTTFDVSPSAIDVSVGHKSVRIEKSFQVTGFSIGGRVVNNNGKGIENVRIFVDDVERSKTDAGGFYKIDQVTSTAYTITAVKDHFKFTSLKGYAVLPNMASLPSIEAIAYDVCGVVHLPNDSQYGRRQVALTHGPLNVKPQTKRVNDASQFCFEVPAGEYRVSPLATSAEQQAGLLFSPSHRDVIVDGPVLDVIFSQAQVSICGRVISVGELTSSSKVGISLVSNATNETRVIYLTEDTNEFTFEKVFPGKYKLEIRSEGYSENQSLDDMWCWEQKSVDVDVYTNDVKDIVFVQKGYWLSIESTHPVRAFTLQKERDAMPFQITKGSQQVCVNLPGVHELHFVWPCVYFGAVSFTFDTSNPKPIRLVGEKYVLSGHINVDSRIYSNANNLEKHILVDIRHKEDRKLVDSSVYARLAYESNQTNPIAVYEYAHWAELGDVLQFSPRYMRSDGDEGELLFYPREQEVHVLVDGCQGRVGEFTGRPGVYITGHVSPPLEGVNISIICQQESGVRQGEAALQVVTGEDGTYYAGPLCDDATYLVQAEKEGYHLKSLDNTSFSCEKLSEISVSILHGNEGEEGLSGVLLLLSGDDGYRMKAATSTKGTFSFRDLFPGSFYLRPVLKEYSFTPSAQAIELSSGQTLHITFIAQRSAYSIYGRVTSLCGEVEEGINVEARSQEHYEETVSDSQGKYRLRGLVAGRIYSVKPVVKDSLDRASPHAIHIQVAANDSVGADFVVFEKSRLGRITGVVEGLDHDTWHGDVLVEVSSSIEPYRVEREIVLPPSCYFQVSGLVRAKYNVIVRRRTSSSSSSSSSSSMVSVNLENESAVHIEKMRMSEEKKILEQKQEYNVAPVVVVGLAVGVGVIFIFATMPRLKDTFGVRKQKKYSS